MAILTEVNRLLFTYFLCHCRRPPFLVKLLNLNFGGNGNFLDFLFQDTFNAVLLRYLSDVVGVSCWFKK